MDRLVCTVMPYAWGSRTTIAELTGRSSPSDGPEAELWMGAHPMAPSRAMRDGADATLDQIVAKDPERELGADVLREFGPRLPFLLKVLAAAQPLSLQAHPTAERARTGFEDEERRGIPRDAPTRNYRDASHKPELLCAITPVEALSGFREIDATLRLFDSLAVSDLDPVLEPLRASRDAAGLATAFHRLMTLPGDECARVVGETVRACAHAHNDAFAKERAWALRLATLYPGDIGIVSALFLELVHLSPGEAIYLGAGNLHAYLHGSGVEIMASSDNVLRGGLTKKHVDVVELLDVLDFAAAPPVIVRPRAIDAHESVYDTPAREFRLSRLILDDFELARDDAGPEILLATSGSIALQDDHAMTQIESGDAVFVPAATKRYVLRGSGTLFRARTNT